MTNVSRPLIALLVGTVAFFALWIVALKPSASGSAAHSGGLGQYQSAINAARKSVKLQDQQGATAANVPTTATPSAPAATPAAHDTAAAPAAKAAATPAPATAPAAATNAARHARRPDPRTTVDGAGAAHRFNLVTHTLRADKVLAILFYNPAGADDRAVKQELASVPRYGGRVVKLAIPVAELARYAAITTQVVVSTTPTLVLIDRRRQASLITGFADRFEIVQRVEDALAVK
jgi:hypothetical protein